jgi:transcriptional regulator with XRE-family HTH domain
MTQIASRLKKLMESEQFKQIQSAKRSGVSQSTINRILHSQNSPTYRTLCGLSKGFNVPTEYFTHPCDMVADIILNLSTMSRDQVTKVLDFVNFQKQQK